MKGGRDGGQAGDEGWVPRSGVLAVGLGVGVVFVYDADFHCARGGGKTPDLGAEFEGKMGKQVEGGGGGGVW